MLLVSDRTFTLPGLADEGSLLSVREAFFQKQLSDLPRAARWYHGRIIAKYLFLDHLNYRTEPCACRNFTVEHFNRFTEAAYKSVEVLAGTNGRPILHWCGKAQSATVSLSYSGVYAAAVLSTGHYIGIDLEQITERRPEFYIHSFTAFEQAQVADLCEDQQQRVWLYTLLWTIKEAGLKAAADDRWTIWNLPLMEIDLGAASQQLRSLYRGESRNIAISVSIKGFEEQRSANLVIHQFNHYLLTTLYYE